MEYIHNYNTENDQEYHIELKIVEGGNRRQVRPGGGGTESNGEILKYKDSRLQHLLQVSLVILVSTFYLVTTSRSHFACVLLWSVGKSSECRYSSIHHIVFM